MRRIKLENLQTIKQRTKSNSKTEAHSNPLWIVGGAGQYLKYCKHAWTISDTYNKHTHIYIDTSIYE